VTRTCTGQESGTWPFVVDAAVVVAVDADADADVAAGGAGGAAVDPYDELLLFNVDDERRYPEIRQEVKQHPRV
jgi:hypothetical protein